jgi:hypothetical protein
LRISKTLKIMFDTSVLGTAERCRVLLRLKPLPGDETSPIQVDGPKILIRRELRESSISDEGNSTFSFDHVFEPETGQEEIFQSVLQDSIEPVLSGG